MRTVDAAARHVFIGLRGPYCTCALRAQLRCVRASLTRLHDRARLAPPRAGLHPTLKAELRRLEEVRQRHKAEAAALREARERVANEEFEREKKAAEDDFKAEEELLRDRFLNEFEERRRRTDEGRFDGQLSQMRAAAIRKMRTRSNVESGGGGGGASLASKSKREKLSWTAVQFALKPADIHDDFEELQRSYAWSLRHAEGVCRGCECAWPWKGGLPPPAFALIAAADDRALWPPCSRPRPPSRAQTRRPRRRRRRPRSRAWRLSRSRPPRPASRARAQKRQRSTSRGRTQPSATTWLTCA